jgi:hypothetical protein
MPSARRYDAAIPVLVLALCLLMFSLAHGQSDPNAPVIDRVEVLTDPTDESAILQRVYFIDPDNNAYLVDYDVVESSQSGVAAGDGMLTSGIDQTVLGYTEGRWTCGTGTGYTVTLSVRLLDRAGNESNTVEYTMVCGSFNQFVVDGMPIEAANQAVSERCPVTVTTEINARWTPSPTGDPLPNGLEPGTYNGVAQTIGTDGMRWIQLDFGYWVRSDIVTLGDGCDSLADPAAPATSTPVPVATGTARPSNAAQGSPDDDIFPGEPVVGRLTGGTDLEYDFTVTTTATISLLLTSDNFDTYLNLYEGTDLLYSDDDGAGNLDSLIEEVTLFPGTYTAVVTSFSGSESGDFILTLTSEASTSASDTTTGTALTAGVPLEGTLGAGETLEFNFVVGSSAVLTMRLNSDDFDPFLQIFRAGTRVDFDDDSGGNYDSLISNLPVSPGTYTAVVSSYYVSGSGGFTLSYTLSAPPVPTSTRRPTQVPPTSTPVAPGTERVLLGEFSDSEFIEAGGCEYTSRNPVEMNAGDQLDVSVTCNSGRCFLDVDTPTLYNTGIDMSFVAPETRIFTITTRFIAFESGGVCFAGGHLITARLFGFPR